MTKKHKKTSKFQKLTNIMAVLMAIITLAGIIVPLIGNFM